MAGSKILLDTNIVSALFNGEISIANQIDKADEVYIPVIVMGELYDIWIAALSKQHRLILITRNRHFTNIANLDIDKW